MKDQSSSRSRFVGKFPLTRRQLTALSMVTVVLVMFIVMWRILASYRDEVETSDQARAGAIASSVAAEVDAEAHNQLIRGITGLNAVSDWKTTPAAAQQMHALFVAVAKANGLSTPVYTLHLRTKKAAEVLAAPNQIHADAMELCMTSAAKACIGEPFDYRPEMAAALFRGQLSYSAMYQDDFGTWMSAYAPLKDAAGNVTSIVAVDDTVQAHLAQMHERLLRQLAAMATCFATAMAAVGILFVSGRRGRGESNPSSAARNAHAVRPATPAEIPHAAGHSANEKDAHAVEVNGTLPPASNAHPNDAHPNDARHRHRVNPTPQPVAASARAVAPVAHSTALTQNAHVAQPAAVERPAVSPVERPALAAKAVDYKAAGGTARPAPLTRSATTPPRANPVAGNANTNWRAGATPVQADGAGAPAEPLDVKSLLDRCRGEAGLVETLLYKFQQQIGGQVASIRKSLIEQDPGSLARLAHGVRGVAANLSAEPLRAIALELERLGAAGQLVGADDCAKRLEWEVEHLRTYVPYAVNAVKVLADSTRAMAGQQDHESSPQQEKEADPQ